MSISLPHWFVEVVDLLGFLWPEIDEDQLVEAGRHLREYAEHSSGAMAAHGRQIADLGQHLEQFAQQPQQEGRIELGCGHELVGGEDVDGEDADVPDARPGGRLSRG